MLPHLQNASCPHQQARKWQLEWGSSTTLPCLPAELHRREPAPWGHHSLFLGAGGFFLSGKKQICSCSWLWSKEYMQFPTHHQSLSLEHRTPMVQQLWRMENVHLEGEGCFWNRNPFLHLTSLFKKISDSWLIQLCQHSPKATGSPAPTPQCSYCRLKTPALPQQLFFLSCFANICHPSFIALKTTLRALFLNHCQSHLQGNPRQAGTGTQSFLLV